MTQIYPVYRESDVVVLALNRSFYYVQGEDTYVNVHSLMT